MCQQHTYLGLCPWLQASPVWKALIDDAEARGSIVHNATAAELFPDMTELVLMQANRAASPEQPPKPGPATDPRQLQPPGLAPVSMQARQQQAQQQPGSEALRPPPRQGQTGAAAAGGMQTMLASQGATAASGHPPGLHAPQYLSEQAGKVRPPVGSDPRVNAQGQHAAMSWSQPGQLTPAQLAIQQGKLAQQQEALEKQQQAALQKQHQASQQHQVLQPQQQHQQHPQQQAQQQPQPLQQPQQRENLAQEHHMPQQQQQQLPHQQQIPRQHPQQLQQPLQDSQQLQQAARQAWVPMPACMQPQPVMPSRLMLPGHAQAGLQFPGGAHQTSHAGPYVLHGQGQLVSGLVPHSQEGQAAEQSHPRTATESDLVMSGHLQRQHSAAGLHAPLHHGSGSFGQQQAQTQPRHSSRDRSSLNDRQLSDQHLVDPAGQGLSDAALGRAGLQHSSTTPQVPLWTRNRR